MNKAKWQWLLESYPPADVQEIETAQAALGVTIPEVYKEFLRCTNGAVGNLASLYGCDTLVEMNAAYEVQQYAPGYIAVGNDGGGYHLLMRAEAAAEEFQLVGQGSGVPQAGDCQDNFRDWLCSAQGDPWRNKREQPKEYVTLILKALPAGGLAGIQNLVRALGLPMSPAEFYKRSRELPLILFQNIELRAAQAKTSEFATQDLFEIRPLDPADTQPR